MQEGAGGNGGAGREGPGGAGEGGHEGGPASAIGANMGQPNLPSPLGAAAGSAPQPRAQAPAMDPYTQLINMILRSQLGEQLSQFFNPASAMPGAGSMFTPGQTVPPAAGAGAPGATGMPQAGALPTPTAFLPGATGQAAVAPSGGFTPGLPNPVDASAPIFQPPTQGPSYAQGTAGANQGWEQFLGFLGGGNLPQPTDMAGGGSLLMGA
jgi:hypothetical protein